MRTCNAENQRIKAFNLKEDDRALPLCNLLLYTGANWGL